MTTTMNPMPRNFRPDVDVGIVGAGPAGRWLGAQLCRRGISIALIDPAIERRWPNNYGVWFDEVESFAHRLSFDRVWEHASVYTPGRTVLPRRYARIDNRALRRRLDEVIDAGDGQLVADRVGGVRRIGDGVALRTHRGGPIRARLAIDASGAPPAVVDSPVSNPAICQRAYGFAARFDGDPLCGDEMVLMDYRPVDGEADDPVDVPTFLYGMHLGGDLYFVEETVLVGDHPVPFEHLRRRLHRRLADRNADVVESLGEPERCHIPMGTRPVAGENGVVAFGTSAGFVHPATGYQLGRMLRSTPTVADAIADGLHRGDGAETLARRAGRAMWPASFRRTHRLLSFGRDVLLTLDRNMAHRFFETFFSLSEPRWRVYLRGDAVPGDIAGVMWRLFRRADLPLRRRLAAVGFQSGLSVAADFTTAPRAFVAALRNQAIG